MFKEAPGEGHGSLPCADWVILGKKGLAPFHQEGALFMGS